MRACADGRLLSRREAFDEMSNEQAGTQAD